MIRTITKALLATFFLSNAAIAADSMPTGSFKLYSEANYQTNNFCDIGTDLVMDHAEISGDIVFLSNFVVGFCELYVAPRERSFLITSITPDGCGSVTYSGSRMALDGVEEISITDNRKRFCKNLVPALIIVDEVTAAGTSTLYSDDRIALPPIRMCTAEAGVLFNPETGMCQSFFNGCQRSDLMEAGFTDSRSFGECQEH